MIINRLLGFFLNIFFKLAFQEKTMEKKREELQDYAENAKKKIIKVYE